MRIKTNESRQVYLSGFRVFTGMDISPSGAFTAGCFTHKPLQKA
jgi:hypothetical protein